MVPLSSYGISRVPHYSGFSHSSLHFAYKTLTLYRLPSHAVLLSINVAYAVQNPGYIAIAGLASFAFARRYLQNLGWFLFLALLRCFTSGGSLRMTMDSSYGQYPCRYWGFPIRKSADPSVLTAPRSLSQLITSFFGSQCQGIRPALFLALPFALCSEFSWIVNSIHCSFLPDNLFSYRLKLVVSSFALLTFLYSVFKFLLPSP